MPDDNQDPNNPNSDANPNDPVPEAARQILEEIQKTTKKEAPAPPSSQPADPNTAYLAHRENFKKQMNFTEEQMQVYERDKMAAQAPILHELAISKLERTQKDYDQLKEPFLAEVKLYVNRGQVVTPELAEQIFFMIKGRELSAGRYTPPSSQPASAGRPSAAAGSGAPSRRIAPGYNPADPGVSGPGSPGGEENQLSEEETRAASKLNVDVKDYRKMKEEKEKGIREIGERSYRAPDIDVRTANPADRALADLWGKNGGRI